MPEEGHHVLTQRVSLHFLFSIFVPSGPGPRGRVRLEAGSRRCVSPVESPADILLTHWLRLPDLLRLADRHHRRNGGGSLHRVSNVCIAASLQDVWIIDSRW